MAKERPTPRPVKTKTWAEVKKEALDSGLPVSVVGMGIPTRPEDEPEFSSTGDTDVESKPLTEE